MEKRYGKKTDAEVMMNYELRITDYEYPASSIQHQYA
jgi:hypothetical protein